VAGVRAQEFGLRSAATMSPRWDRTGGWPGPGAWGGGLHAVNEFFTVGLPAAYTRAGATVTILTGDHVVESGIINHETVSSPNSVSV